MAGTLERQGLTTHRFHDWFATCNLGVLTALSVLGAALLFGVGARPDIGWVVGVMADPMNLAEDTSTEASSPLMWFVADAVGISSSGGAVALHALFLAFCLTASIAAVAVWVSNYAARLFVVAWFASPLANIELTWLGKPDPGTMLGAVLVTIGPRWATLAGGLLLGVNHFEQGALICAAAVVIRVVVNRESWRVAVPIGMGLLVGKVVLTAYHHTAGAHQGRGEYVSEYGIGYFIDTWSGNVPTLLFSVFAVLWVPIGVMWWHRRLADRVALAAVFAAVTVPVLLTLDTTRVYALVTFPIVVAAVAWWAEPVRRELVARYLGWFLVAAVVVPRVIMWNGKLYVSSW